MATAFPEWYAAATVGKSPFTTRRRLAIPYVRFTASGLTFTEKYESDRDQIAGDYGNGIPTRSGRVCRHGEVVAIDFQDEERLRAI